MALGETILGAVLQVIFDKLASKEVISFFRSEKFDESLIHKLKTLMLAVEKLLLDAEEKQMTDRAVKQWLDELKHWFYCAEEVVNEVATEALRLSFEKESPQPQSLGIMIRNLLPDFRNSVLFHKAITLKISKVVEMLETMLSQKDVLGLREISFGIVPHDQRMPSSCLLQDNEVYGRDEVKNKIIEYMLSEEADRNKIGVVSIVGMGGVGKTTLAKLIYNDARLEGTFDMKFWACVSDQFDICQVTRSILESITHKSYSASQGLNFLQAELRDKLRDKRFLLVLDDVWNENYENWECLRAPFSGGAYGSKIVVTTRNDEVASLMSTASVFHLKPLSNADAWSLFSRLAFEDGNWISDPRMQDVGKEIVKKCGGLPLAIKTLGGLLHLTHEVCQWEAILQSNLWDLPCNKSNIIPALWLSYYHLPSHLKRCFSYCALFPKDYKIERKQLVLLWMAENFLPTTNSERRIEDVGDEFLRQLLSRSFLEPLDESHVTMHDLMHDLAQVLSGNFLLRKELQSPTKVSEKARHFSYAADRYDGITKFQAIPESKHFRTFFRLREPYWGLNQYMTNTVTNTIIPSLSYLRVLSLPSYENLKLPESIGCLKQLCYLDVSGSKITQLPESVATLYNLQTLILSNCSCLERLPSDLANLALLRHLDISGTTLLLHMPKQMSKLNSLQTLTAFIVGEDGGSGIQELMGLRQIHGKLSLRRLQNVVIPNDALCVNLTLIDDLALEFDYEKNDDSQKARELLENLQPPRNLKRLTVRNYVGTAFPRWLEPQCVVYANLTYLCMSGCLYCPSLPPLGQLPSLEELVIEGMEYIVEVGSEFYGHNISGSSRPFPSLVCLRFEKMKDWELWSDLDVEGFVVCFPRLMKLHLLDCPKLKGNLPVRVPSLTEIKIDGCGKLGGVPCDHLVETAPSATDLNSITRLALVGLVQLLDLPQEIVTLSSLTDLYIQNCDNLKSLENVELPSTLNLLEIKGCEFLESLPKNMICLSNLQKLKLSECKRLTGTLGNSLPPSVRFVVVVECETLDLSILREGLEHYTSLETLIFKRTYSQTASFSLGAAPNLKYFELRRCRGLKKVCFSEGIADNNLIPLETLCIAGCPDLEIIGKEIGTGEAAVLPVPNLRCLLIFSCINLKPVVVEREGKVLLPKLERLLIDKSIKMTLEWPLKLRSLRRFLYLTRLTVESEELECFPGCDDWGCLPNSLIYLMIRKCPKLRRLDGKALQTLTSLQSLFFWDCPKLERLPEEPLPASLDFLCIRGCPMLEERCWPGKGQDWPKIHHLAGIRINLTYVTCS